MTVFIHNPGKMLDLTVKPDQRFAKILSGA
jgi:hypothetical protein